VIAHVDDVYGRSVAAGQAEQADKAGIRVVDTIAYNPLGFDPAEIALRVGRARADFLWDVSYLDDGVALWHAVVSARIPLRAAVGTSSAFCMPAFAQRLGAEALGVFAADKPDDQVRETSLSASGRGLLAKARAAYGEETGSSTMPIGAVAGFVGGWTLFRDVLDAVKGPVSSESLRSAALTVDVPVGGTINGGGIRFAQPEAPDAGQNTRAAVVIGQWQNGLEMKVVYPAAYAVASPVLPRS
jgi:branched-chain amino acid transport system substrate-binding protein